MTRRLAAALLAVLLAASPALAREVQFAGYNWYVRDYPGGPGPSIWNPDDVFVDDRTVDVHIGRLRKAINRARDRDLIRTVRGAGYSIESA